jgi:hypothetical protein
VWLPGWTVIDLACGNATCPQTDVEGRPYFAPVRANLTLVGLWVPAGDSTFQLRYAPDSVRFGLWISGATMVVIVLGALWHWQTGHRSDV